MCVNNLPKMRKDIIRRKPSFRRMIYLPFITKDTLSRVNKNPGYAFSTFQIAEQFCYKHELDEILFCLVFKRMRYSARYCKNTGRINTHTYMHLDANYKPVILNPNCNQLEEKKY